MAKLRDGLPKLYEKLLPALFDLEVPEETKATCSSCAMCSPTAVGIEPVDGVSRQFRADTKCCTYYPRLPNFLVGGLLSDDSAAMAVGRGRVEARIASRVSVNPQWVKPPPSYTLLYQNAKQAFGRAGTLRCGYYDSASGGCTIWAYREAVCSTWFCKYVAGADGRQLWMSTKRFLALTEIQLSRWALLQLHPDFVLTGRDREDDKGPLSADDLDERPMKDAEHQAMWGKWAGREGDLFRESFKLVSALSSSDVERILGLDFQIESGTVKRHHAAATATKLPEKVKFNPAATVQWLADGSVGMGAYSDLEAVALPGAVYPLLVQLNGKETVEQVRAKWRSEQGTDLGDELLLELYRQRVLTT